MRAVMIAFSMYSRIPMPFFSWEERDRKRAMWFFPLVGAIVGILFFLAFLLLSVILSGNFGNESFDNEIFGGPGILPDGAGGEIFGELSVGAVCLRAAILTALPVFVTGGIHIDGFLDTCDARGACTDRERRMEILKDSHVGAFAVIWGILYFLLYFCSCMALTPETAAAVSVGFLISRGISGFFTAALPKARKGGMLSDFVADVDQKILSRIMAGYLILGGILMATVFWFEGAVILAAFPLLAAALSAVWCRRIMVREFGGITGDLAGYTLQVCELAMVVCSAAMGCIFF